MGIESSSSFRAEFTQDRINHRRFSKLIPKFDEVMSEEESRIRQRCEGEACEVAISGRDRGDCHPIEIGVVVQCRFPENDGHCRLVEKGLGKTAARIEGVLEKFSE